MQQQLFRPRDEEFALFNETTRKVILRQTMNDFDAELSNEYYQTSLCAHLKWIKASELKVKVYTVKK